MNAPDLGGRKWLIEAIKTPLGFFSLVLLVVEALLGGLALASSGEQRTFLVYAIVGIMVLMILVVAAIAVWRPEALWGKRYSALEETFAAGLGEDIYWALDGSLSNLEAAAREEAYRLLQTTIAGSQYAQSKPTKKFCQVLVEVIIRRAKLKGKWSKVIGVIAK